MITNHAEGTIESLRYNLGIYVVQSTELITAFELARFPNRDFASLRRSDYIIPSDYLRGIRRIVVEGTFTRSSLLIVRTDEVSRSQEIENRPIRYCITSQHLKRREDIMCERMFQHTARCGFVCHHTKAPDL